MGVLYLAVGEVEVNIDNRGRENAGCIVGSGDSESVVAFSQRGEVASCQASSDRKSIDRKQSDSVVAL